MVGGFLGAGKTTLLFETTRMLMSGGKKVGLVTNDQASELVDTAILIQTHARVAEISGSCFCCNFNGFTDSLMQLGNELQVDMIIAEPVGSCTDLSATIMQPLKELLKNELIVSPLTVLADPFRLTEILKGRSAGLHPGAAYIFRKQLEESDIIMISKADLLENNQLELLKARVERSYPNTQVIAASSKTGHGIAEWLKLLESSRRIGQRVVEVDYDTYAEGEAALGWLNSSIELQGDRVSWDTFISNLLRSLSSELDAKKIGVGHIKVILKSEGGQVIGNITGTTDTLSIRGSSGVTNQAQLIINARVGTDPFVLGNMVKDALDATTKNWIAYRVKAWKCLSPSYPIPTYRYSKAVGNE